MALDPEKNSTKLDEHAIAAFKSMIADFRASWDVASLPDTPLRIMCEQGTCELSWIITQNCELITSVENKASGDPEGWKEAHRIRLEYLRHKGQVLK